MPKRFCSVVFVAIAIASGGAFSTIRPPATVIVGQTRDRPKTPFDQAPVIVVAKLRERRVVETLRDDGQSYVPPKLHREYRLLRFAVRINKPAASDPNSDRSFDFLLEQTPEVSFNLEFGREYVLFLRRSEDALVGPDSPPLYTVAFADVGFELGSKTLRVLRRGGPLTAYDGHPSEEVLRLIDPQYVDVVWRPAHPKH